MVYLYLKHWETLRCTKKTVGEFLEYYNSRMIDDGEHIFRIESINHSAEKFINEFAGYVFPGNRIYDICKYHIVSFNIEHCINISFDLIYEWLENVRPEEKTKTVPIGILYCLKNDSTEHNIASQIRILVENRWIPATYYNLLTDSKERLYIVDLDAENIVIEIASSVEEFIKSLIGE